MTNQTNWSRNNGTRNNGYQNNRYQGNRPQNNGSRRPQNNGGQNYSPRENANGLQVPPKFLLYAFAFVIMASAMLGGLVSHSVWKPKAETNIVCESTGGLFGIGCQEP